jgi:rhodanese-related sulfurtransferase
MKKSFLLLILLNCFFVTGIKAQDSLMFRSLDPYDFHLQYLKEDPSILIDVREPFEFKSKRIKGAINIPASGNLEAAADTLDRNNAIFLYCTSGFRSDKAARSLYEKGFQKLYSLKGGIIQWQREGMKVEKKRRGSEKRAGSREH